MSFPQENGRYRFFSGVEVMMVCPELIQAIMDAGGVIFTKVYVAIHCIMVMQVISFGVDIDCKLVLRRMQGIKESCVPLPFHCRPNSEYTLLWYICRVTGIIEIVGQVI